MKVYQLRPEYDRTGESVFRAICIADKDMDAFLQWNGEHSKGREHARLAFKTNHFEWNDPISKPEADFPGAAMALFSARAADALRPFLEANGDLHPILVNDQPGQYFFYDYWSWLDATTNPEFNMFVPGSLKSIFITPGAVIPDIFEGPGLVGLMVSEQFKVAAEAAGLSGMVFTEVEVISANAVSKKGRH